MFSKQDKTSIYMIFLKIELIFDLNYFIIQKYIILIILIILILIIGNKKM